uniref:Rubisco accumulation factor 1 C-terminal domain-containing protein n=1 Tax=Leersia perrieri TaxID=77586 RepID=A0A0D9XK58_9ORYZ
MLSLSHPHPHADSTTPARHHRRILPSPLPHHHHHHILRRRRRFANLTTSAVILGPDGNPIGGGPRDHKLPFAPPPTAPPDQLYQPFHPPPSPLPEKYRALDLAERLAVLRDRLGLWYEYAPLVSALSREGFTPSSIEEATGISGVEQNRIVVASQVRDSLLSENFPDEMLPYFDSYGGPELLYELRFLNARQRADAARNAIDRRLEPRGVRELARSMKDFPRRRGDDGWGEFDRDSPGDCLAFARFRQSREQIDPEDAVAELERAMQVVETDAARARVEVEMERARRKAAGEEIDDEEASPELARPDVPVVRLMYGEVAEATTVLLLPVVRETEGVEAMTAAPRRTKTDVDLGLVEVDKGWTRWAVVPGWGPVAEVAGEVVVIELADGRTLPWRSAEEERVLVVANRGRREVVESGIYVVEKEGRLVVERGRKLAEQGVAEAAAEVLIVVRQPKDEDDMISDDEWD